MDNLNTQQQEQHLQSLASRIAIASLLLLSFVGYYLLAYNTERTEVYQVFTLFGVLFLAYGGMYRLAETTTTFRLLLFSGILFRILLLFVLPNLSDDFYRFNWDGRLLVNGISPFEALPIHFIDGTYTDFIPSNINIGLYEKLNSPEYFTIYPPVCQFVFWIACSLFPNDLYSATVVMKGCMLLFEIGSIFLLYQMVKAFGGNLKKVLLYALNPLVIVELTGNLHFEAAMIFFLLLAVWLLMVDGGRWTVDGRRWTADGGREMVDERRQTMDGERLTVDGEQLTVDGERLAMDRGQQTGNDRQEMENGRQGTANSFRLPSTVHRPPSTISRLPSTVYRLSALSMGLAISSKLIPLIFLPLLIPLLGWWRSFLYGSIAGIVTLLGFASLFTFDILQNLFSSIGLYFQKFEFNASVYYLVRWLGYQYYGYNIIQSAGKWLALLTLGSILVLAFWRKQESGNRRQETGVEKKSLRFWLSLEEWKRISESFIEVLRIRSSFGENGLSLEGSKRLLEKALFALLLYFAFANIVHPWYVCSLVALCVFTPFRFPIVWSIMAVLTYYTYLTDAYMENLYLVGLEYLIVYGVLIWELWRIKIKNS